MNLESELTTESVEGQSSLLMLAFLSLLVGVVSGLVVAIFRLALDQADRIRGVLLAWAHDEALAGCVLVIAVCAVATAVAAWLVRCFSPQAEGSGIPHVEAVVSGALLPAPFRLLPVKFFGSLLALGAGLALGREGPSVQMGATLAHLLGQACRRNVLDCRVLLAAGAGAGLATAFNAPIAGAVFVLEELVRRFDTRIAIAALGASATAMLVARLFLGNEPEFSLGPLAYTGPPAGALFLALGVVAGLAAVAYNRTLLAAIAAAERLRRWPVELRAALVGVVVGFVAWFNPGMVGGR